MLRACRRNTALRRYLRLSKCMTNCHSFLVTLCSRQLCHSLSLICVPFFSMLLTPLRLLLASAPVASISSLHLHLRPRRASLIALISSRPVCRPPGISSFVDTVLLLSSRKRPSYLFLGRYYSSYLALGFPSLRHFFLFFYVTDRSFFQIYRGTLSV